MKKMIILGLVPISELVKVTGTSASNIQKTYINNINGINKDKMLEALSIGAYMMEKKLKPKDVRLARKLVLASKEKDEPRDS